MPTASSLLLSACLGVPATLALHHLTRQAPAPPYTLPQFEAEDQAARTSEVQEKRAGWLYGPSIAGNTSFYPAGPLGEPAALAEVADLAVVQDAILANATADSQLAGAAAQAAGGLTSLGSYRILYQGQWNNSAPGGPYAGLLTNYTNDLLFSMEQLSLNPYKLVRLSRDAELPFSVANAASISGGLTLEELHGQGRLFLADFLDQKDLPTSTGKYGAACQAYFFIHPASADFLPLAIKTNVDGAEDLVYTAEDEANDWLLAKILFNINNFWFAQWWHLAATHETVEIVYLAAIRTLSDRHPVMALMHRLMKFAWAMRPFARDRLVMRGGPVDQLFPWAGSLAANYTDALYQSGQASSFQANYFLTDLRRRGLVDAEPALKHFPFYEDASVIHTEIRTLAQTVVDAYYADDAVIEADAELQSWLGEAVPARIFDFPAAPLRAKSGLVDMLTHLAHLVSVAHGTLNGNSPVYSSASLPFHPLSLYAPLPTAKGTVRDIMTYMPGVAAAAGQIRLLAAFNRPTFKDSTETLTHMFDDADMLARMKEPIRQAADVFKGKMEAFAKVVRARTFDQNGLSQGMPFIWTTLDPSTASYWLTI